LIIKSTIIAFVLAAAGFLLYPELGLEQLTAENAARVFSYSILAGALLGAILINIKLSVKLPGNRIESIFVGNLAFKASAGALRELFEEYGEVHAVRLMTDRVTRRPRGYAFVEMAASDAKQAIAALNGTEFYGRELKVNVANERKSK
jgi:RNA recognition motif-containing protein